MVLCCTESEGTGSGRSAQPADGAWTLRQSFVRFPHCVLTGSVPWLRAAGIRSTISQIFAVFTRCLLQSRHAAVTAIVL